MITIEVTNQQSRLPIDAKRLELAVHEILLEANITSGEMSLVVVDDPTIHELNRKHLAHDYPTDVLSFCLEELAGRLVGEVIVSADTAIENASEYGWAPESELLLYVIHGTLHLVGYRDKGEEETLAMRQAETKYLLQCGVEAPKTTGPEIPVSEKPLSEKPGSETPGSETPASETPATTIPTPEKSATEGSNVC